MCVCVCVCTCSQHHYSQVFDISFRSSMIQEEHCQTNLNQQYACAYRDAIIEHSRLNNCTTHSTRTHNLATNSPIEKSIGSAKPVRNKLSLIVLIRDRGSDLYVGIDMVENYCLYKWYGRCSAKKGQKLSQITPN